MTFSLSRFSAPLLAVAALSAAPLMAAGSGYTATLAAASTDKVMAAGTVFVCKGADCSARESSRSPMRVCAALVKEAGPVSAFSFAGKAFDDAKLAKCNAAAG